MRQLKSAKRIAFPTATIAPTTFYLSVVRMVVTAADVTTTTHALWCMWTG